MNLFSCVKTRLFCFMVFVAFVDTVTDSDDSVTVMHQGGDTTTRQRILDATLEALARSGPRKLSMSEVAAIAEVSRPTLYRWFPSKEALLDGFSRHELERFDLGLADAIAGLDGADRLDAVLAFVVEFQRRSSLRRVVAVEPEYVIHELSRLLPTIRERLAPSFPGTDGEVVAATVARVALSHAIVPEDDPELFLAELRNAARRPIPRRKAS